jgi:hypothetical protein
MTKEPSPDVQDLARRLSQKTGHIRGRGRRSPLFRWMWQRVAMTSDRCSTRAGCLGGRRAELPDTDEIRDGRDKRPTGERVRRTWYEVRLAKGWISQPAPDLTPLLVEIPAKPVRAVRGAFSDDTIRGRPSNSSSPAVRRTGPGTPSDRSRYVTRQVNALTSLPHKPQTELV